MTNAKLLIVPGGGGGRQGAAGNYEGGGGNAGTPYYSAAYDLSIGTHNVVVGAGGISNGNGGLSSFDTTSVAGGLVGATSTRGGNGAATAGVNGVGHNGGAGGNGIQYSISGTATYYSGGGGGSCPGNVDGVGGVAGLGSTGTGATYGTVGNASAVNLGGGGGGGSSVGSKAGGVGGSGVVIVRYLTAEFGNCTGGTKTTVGADTVHTFTTSGTLTVVEKINNYKASGTAVFGPYVLPEFIENPTESTVGWTANLPANTAIYIQAAIVVGSPVEGDFITVTNGGVIPGLDVSSSGKNLYFKATLSTTDTAVAPALLSLGYQIVEAVDTTKVQINLTDTGRIKYPAGNVAVSYSKTTGNLTGELGGQVESFIQPFTPTNIDEVFNPNDIEHLNAITEMSLSCFEVTYKEGQVLENITSSMETTIVVTKVGDLPL